MRVQLVSVDQLLHKTCRNVLAQFHQIDWKLAAVSSSAGPGDDLYVWDYECEPRLAGEEQIPSHKKVFVVSRENLASLQERISGKPSRVLLKPVNPFILKSLIAEILAAPPPSEPVERDGRLAAMQRDRDELLQSMLELNLRLQEYDQARSSFLADGAHDLRFPAMAILGYSKLLAEGQLGPINKDQLKVIRHVEQSAQRLYRLANSMFQAILGVGARFKPRLQRADIEATVNLAVPEVTPVAEARNVAIRVEIEPPAVPLVFDQALILQVLVNLLDNAARLAPKGGQAAIRGFPVFWDRRASNLTENVRLERRVCRIERPNSYRIEVTDSGPAIEQTKLDRIFDDYTSAECPSGPLGTRLGLGTCRQIIDLHQGHIFAEPGKKSCFAFILPNARDVEGIDALRTNAGMEERLSANNL